MSSVFIAVSGSLAVYAITGKPAKSPKSGWIPPFLQWTAGGGGGGEWQGF